MKLLRHCALIRTIAAINIIDEADAEWFKAFREHDFRLSKLEKLIDRYAATK